MPVKSAATLMSNILNQRTFYPYYVQLILAGWDSEGRHVYSLDAAGGAIPDKYTSAGSGSPYVFGVLEDTFKDDLSTDEGIDLAIRVGQLEDSMLVSKKLRSCFFQAVASPQYLKEYGTPKHPEDFKQHNCIIYGRSKEGNDWPFLMKDNETIMLKPKGKLTSNDGLLMISAALEGMGIAFGPSFMFKQHLDLGTLSLLLPKCQLPTAISAIYPANRNLPRRVRVLIDFLDENLSV